MRAAYTADHGAFHGELAKRRMCWFLEEQNDGGAWAIWDAAAISKEAEKVRKGVLSQ